MGIAEDILGTFDLRTTEVAVPEWDRTVRVKELGLQEGLALMQSIGPVGDDESVASITMTGEDVAKVVAWGVINEAGERVFSDEQIPLLASKNRDVLMRLYSAIVSLSGGSEDAEKN